jgi:hypothetical protein
MQPFSPADRLTGVGTIFGRVDYAFSPTWLSRNIVLTHFGKTATGAEPRQRVRSIFRAGEKLRNSRVRSKIDPTPLACPTGVNGYWLMGAILAPTAMNYVAGADFAQDGQRIR